MRSLVSHFYYFFIYFLDDWSDLSRKEAQWLKENEHKIDNEDTDDSSTTEEEIDEEDDFQKIAPAATEQKDGEEDEDEEPIKNPSITVPKVKNVKNVKKQRATVVSRGNPSVSTPTTGDEPPLFFSPPQSNDNSSYLKEQFEGVFKKLNEISKQQEHIYQKIKLLENSLTRQKNRRDEDESLGCYNISTTATVTPIRQSLTESATASNDQLSLPGGSPQSLPGGAPMNIESFNVVRKRLGLSKKAKQREEESCPTLEIPTNAWTIATEVQQQAVSFRNFAALFVITYFDNQELVGKICNGKGDRGLGSAKLDIVRALCWKYYPTDMGKFGAWRQCKVSIDEILRRGRRTQKRYSYAVLQADS